MMGNAEKRLPGTTRVYANTEKLLPGNTRFYSSAEKLLPGSTTRFYAGGLDASGKPHGAGTLRCEDWIFTGLFRHGERTGVGTCRYLRTGLLYCGEWEADTFHGRGTYQQVEGWVGPYRGGLWQWDRRIIMYFVSCIIGVLSD